MLKKVKVTVTNGPFPTAESWWLAADVQAGHIDKPAVCAKCDVCIFESSKLTQGIFQGRCGRNLGQGEDRGKKSSREGRMLA